jgi:hypothetical protein
MRRNRWLRPAWKEQIAALLKRLGRARRPQSRRRWARSGGPRFAHGPRLRAALGELGAGLGLFLLLLGAKVAFEHTVAGEAVQYAAYDWLQTRLSSVAQEIVIVDIRQVPVSTLQPGNRLATDADSIAAIVSALARHEPAAIFIDIDLSPFEDKPVTSGHLRLLDTCLVASQGTPKRPPVPTYVAVGRSQAARASVEWLGEARLSSLAVGAALPREHTRSAPAWLLAHTSQDTLWCVAPVLAQTIVDRAVRPPAYPRWFAEQFKRKTFADGAQSLEFLIDFSPLQPAGTVVCSPRAEYSDTSMGRIVRGKVVLIGDANRDTPFERGFVPPASGASWPGIYVHACAINTLTRAPLFSLTSFGRLLCDFVFSVTVLVVLVMTQLRAGGQRHGGSRAALLHVLLTTAAAAAVLILGSGLVSLSRLMWDDFVLVMVCLVLHVYLEPVWVAGRAMQKDLWHRLKQLAVSRAR